MSGAVVRRAKLGVSMTHSSWSPHAHQRMDMHCRNVSEACSEVACSPEPSHIRIVEQANQH